MGTGEFEKGDGILMDPHEALTKARGLLNQHGLNDWQLKLDGAIRRFGFCAIHSKEISLSRHLILMNDWPQVQNTTLHEIAHALSGPGAGHGYKWKGIARKIGCTGDRCYDANEVKIPEARFKGICPGCGATVLRNRRKRIACTKCCQMHGDGHFDARFLFGWSRNQEDGGVMADEKNEQVLTRKYKGKVHRLIVEKQKDGTVKYCLGSKNGKVFKSLSGAAQGVTGIPTSGKGWWGLLKKGEKEVRKG